MTREEWLKRAVRTLRPMLRKAGIKMRPRWQVSMSLTAKKNVIGICCYEVHSASSKTVNIMICPSLGDPVDVLDTLFHEMIHASLPYGVHHGAKFARACQCTGWTKNKPTSASAGPEMRAVLERVARFLGPFSHDPFVFKAKGGGSKGGYWPVYESPVDPRYRVQVSERSLQELGPPICPISREPMQLATGKAPRWPSLPSLGEGE